MPTAWIVPLPNSAVFNALTEASWTISTSDLDSTGQHGLHEPDVIIYHVRSEPVDDTFQSFCQAHLAPLLALVANWDLAWQAIEAGADDALVTHSPKHWSMMKFSAHVTQLH